MSFETTSIWRIFFRYHLQALRHLYVLAAEPRLLVPRDIESKELVSCHVEVELCDTIWYKGRTLVMTAPVMLPELKYLKRVTIQDSRYHQVKVTIKLKSEHWTWIELIVLKLFGFIPDYIQFGLWILESVKTTFVRFRNRPHQAESRMLVIQRWPTRV